MLSPEDHIEAVLRVVLRSELWSRAVVVPPVGGGDAKRQRTGDDAKAQKSPAADVTSVSKTVETLSRAVLDTARKFVIVDAVNADEPMKGDVKPVNTHILKLIESAMD